MIVSGLAEVRDVRTKVPMDNSGDVDRRPPKTLYTAGSTQARRAVSYSRRSGIRIG